MLNFERKRAYLYHSTLTLLMYLYRNYDLSLSFLCFFTNVIPSFDNNINTYTFQDKLDQLKVLIFLTVYLMLSRQQVKTVPFIAAHQ